MWKVTFKGLLAHKTRFVSTFLAVFLGVAFLSGTLVLTDTIKTSFDDLFGDVYRGTDAYVRSTEKVSGEGPGEDIRKRLDDSIVPTVMAVDGVADVAAEINVNHTQVVGSDGKALGTPGRGAPTFGANWADNPKLNPFRISDGRPPTADDEVVIDKSSATKGHLKVGDTISIVLPTATEPQRFHLVGIAKFGTADSPLGASYSLFTLATAERYLTQPGKIDAIRVQAKPGVSQQELATRIQSVLPEKTEALTGEQITKEAQDQIAQNISFISIFFTAFAVVAVVVGGFVIFNTFSIIVAQRAREMALLRSIGAARRQVLTSVIGEAVIVGIVASAIGVVGGIGVGAGLKALFGALGFDLPASGLVVKSSTIVIGMIVGVTVTLLAAIIPAVKASRVPPIAAMRDVAFERPAASRARVITGAVITGLGVLNIIRAVASGTGGPLGLGVAATLIGTVVLGPVVAKPVSRIVGWPVPAVKGMTGSIARENAMRNPRRTAATANALLIGVGIVSLITVLYGSLRTSIDHQIDQAFTGDITITSGSFDSGGVSPTLAATLNKLPEVEAAAPMRFGIVGDKDSSTAITAVDPATFTKVVDVEVKQGDLSSLGTDGIAVHDTIDVRTADGQHTHPKLGDTWVLKFLETGEQKFTVKAIFHRENITSSIVVSTATIEANSPNSLDAFVFVKFTPGVPFEQGRAAVEQAAKPYPTAKVQDIHELKQTFESRIATLFGLILIMLALAIVIALLGIANTLRLSVYERTRELGLLRAVGMTRAQVRSSIRWESAIISLFGTIGGLVLGFFFGWAVVSGLGGSDLTFAPPIPLLVTILVVGAIAGVVAAIRPARKAARLDVLQAIATE